MNIKKQIQDKRIVTTYLILKFQSVTQQAFQKRYSLTLMKRDVSASLGLKLSIIPTAIIFICFFYTELIFYKKLIFEEY